MNLRRKPFKVLFARDALEELSIAKRWYNEQLKGLGKKLQSDVTLTIGKIKRNPFFEPIKYEGIRIASCKLSPYSLHYQVDAENLSVLITVFIHQHRKPFWLPEISDNEDNE